MFFICKYCGIEFELKNGKKDRGKFCSRKCANIYHYKNLSNFGLKARKGKPAWNKGLTKEIDLRVKQSGKKGGETRLKRETEKGCNNPMYGKVGWNKGLTKEIDPRIAQSAEKSRKSQKGEKSHLWKGGISNLPYSFDFDNDLKELIRFRDNYQCQLCGVSEAELLKKLAIHHIDYDKKNSISLNLISLCNSCHSKTIHSRSKWKRFFKDKIFVIIDSKITKLKETEKIFDGPKLDKRPQQVNEPELNLKLNQFNRSTHAL